MILLLVHLSRLVILGLTILGYFQATNYIQTVYGKKSAVAAIIILFFICMFGFLTIR